MSIVNARDIMMAAAKEGWAVGAFNITDLAQMVAVVEAAAGKQAPVIIQTSVKPSKFYGRGVLVAAYRALAEAAPVPVCLHLDHCTWISAPGSLHHLHLFTCIVCTCISASLHLHLHLHLHDLSQKLP